MREQFVRSGPLMELASYPPWAQDLMGATREAKDKVVRHDLFAMMREARLPPGPMRKFLLAGWPLVEQFPQFMANNLCKIQYERSAGEKHARRYLMKNIRVEQNHADHWLEWAAACDVGPQELFKGNLPVECQALVHWCWHSCERSSLATSMAATNLAIEGATGEWSTLICSLPAYEQSFPPALRGKATRWLKMHAQYDDTHPWEALDIICSLIGTDAKAGYTDILIECIRNSYLYMKLSLDCCMSERLCTF